MPPTAAAYYAKEENVVDPLPSLTDADFGPITCGGSEDEYAKLLQRMRKVNMVRLQGFAPEAINSIFFCGDPVTVEFLV